MNDAHLLSLINQRIIELLGLNFPANKSKDLERGMLTAAQEFGIEPNLEKILAWISSPHFGNNELKALSSALTVNETYFFREKPALNVLKNIIIPELIAQRKDTTRTIKIWSAGCSSGEEPYTLAILLREYFPQLKDWNVTILATDISPAVLQKALNGDYSEWSFRETDDYLRKKYFKHQGKHWQIIPEIKKMITFSFLNLSKNSYPSSLTNTQEMDVVFCRNVMMYFTEEVIKQVSSRFYSALLPGGWFVTSQVELNDEYFGQFARVQVENGIFYRKVPRQAKELKLPLEEYQSTTPIAERHRKPAVALKTTVLAKSTAPTRRPMQSPVRENPEHTPDYYFSRRQFQLCIEGCKKALEKDAGNIQLKGLLAKSLAHTGHLDKAEQLIVELIGARVNDAELYYLYALILNDRNETPLVEEMLNKALYIDSQHLHSNLMMGQLLRAKGNAKGARIHFRVVLSGIEHHDDAFVMADFDHMTVGRLREMIERQN